MRKFLAGLALGGVALGLVGALVKSSDYAQALLATIITHTSFRPRGDHDIVVTVFGEYGPIHSVHMETPNDAEHDRDRLVIEAYETALQAAEAHAAANASDAEEIERLVEEVFGDAQ